MWAVVTEWIRRIVQIGVMQFLASLSWKVWVTLAAAVIILFGLVIALSLVLVSILL